MNIANICRERRERRERILEIRSRIAQGKKDKKTVRPNPRYDEVFFNGTLELFSGELALNQEPLGSEFEQVLHENLWDLYQI
jgi:hypothetical protein